MERLLKMKVKELDKKAWLVTGHGQDSFVILACDIVEAVEVLEHTTDTGYLADTITCVSDTVYCEDKVA